MSWLTDWDDLIHGTATFGVAVPFVLALLLMWKLRARWWWIAGVVALAGPFLWFFGVPKIPPTSSEQLALGALTAMTIALAVESGIGRRRFSQLGLRVLVVTALAWFLYPAWLASDGGAVRKWFVCGGMGLSVAIYSLLAEIAIDGSCSQPVKRLHFSTSAFIPPVAALAVLLQLGGAGRFAQSTAAVASVAFAASFEALRGRKAESDLGTFGALISGMFASFAWAGWLFAEIRYGLAALLFAAPIVGALVNLLPLPRRSVFQRMLWDTMASAIVSATVAGIAIAEYLSESAESDGY